LAGLNFAGAGAISMTPSAGATPLMIGVGGLTAKSGAVCINIGGAALSSGTYALIGYSGSIGGAGFSAFAKGSTPVLGPRDSWVLIDNPQEIDLSVTTLHPTWTGANGSEWSTNPVTNWTVGAGTVTAFLSQDVVNVLDGASSGTLDISNGNVTPNAVMVANNAQNFVISGSNSIVDGSVATTLTKSGSGTLTITSSNTYSGGTVLNAGLLQFGNALALGSGNLALGGGTLTFSDTTGYSLANPLSLSGSVTLGDDVNNGALSFNATAGTLLGNATLTVASPVTINSALSGGTFGLAKMGDSILTLANANAYTGGTTVSGGTLMAANDNALGGGTLLLNPAAGSAVVVFSSAAPAIGSLGDNGGGTSAVVLGNAAASTPTLLTLGGNNASTTYSGTIGDLSLANSAAVGALNKIGTGNVTLSGNNTFTGGITVNGGSITLGSATALGTGNLTINGAGTANFASFVPTNNVALNGGTLALTGGGGASGTITLANSAGNTFSLNGNYAVLSGQVTGPGGFTVAGINAPGLALSNPANDFQGNITVNNGAYLRLDASNVVPSIDSILLNGSLKLSDAGATTNMIAGLSGIGMVFQGNGTSGGNTLVIGAGGVSSTFNGTLGGNGQNNNFSLVKTGSGVLTLTAANSYSGGTSVNGGMLVLGNDASLGTGSVTLNGGSLKRDNALSTVANNLTLGASGGTLIGQYGGGIINYVNFSGQISGTGALATFGLVMLSNTNNNFLGNISANSIGGTNGYLYCPVANVIPATSVVAIGDNSANFRVDADQHIAGLTGTGTVWQVNGAASVVLTLAPSAGQNYVYGGNFTTALGSIALVKDGAGTQELDGAASTLASITVNAGVLKFNATGMAFNNTGGLGNGAPVTINSGGTLEIDGTYNAGSTRSIIANGGVIYANGNIGYMNNFTLAGGTLTGGAVQLGYFSNATVTSGTAASTISSNLQLLNSGGGKYVQFTVNPTGSDSADLTITGSITDASGFAGLPLIKAGEGMMVLTGANSYSGSTAIGAGTLQLGNGGTTGTINNTSALVDNGTLAFNHSNNFTFALPITGAGGVNQVGPDALTLSGSSNYIGPTNISAGTLVLSGALGNTAVTVAGGAVLSGTGTIGGSVAVAGGASTVNQGMINLADGVIGTLSLTGAGTTLTLGSGGGNSVIDLDLGGTSTDRIAMGVGSLALNGSVVFNFTQLDGTSISAGTYNLLSFGSLALGPASTFSFSPILGLPSTLKASLNTTYDSEQLIIAPSVPASAYWQAGTGVWSAVGNWSADSAGTTAIGSLPGSTTDLFFATAGGTATIDQNCSVNRLTLTTTNSVTIDGASTLTLGNSAGLTDDGAAAHTISAPMALGTAQTWTINGTNPLTVSGVLSDAAGTTGLTLAGTGTLILANANTYTGGTIIDSGAALQLGDGLSARGSVAGDIADNGLVTFANPTAQSYSGAISGTGAVVAAGPGALTLTGSSSYSGGTTVATSAALQLGDGLLQNGAVTGNIVANGLLAFANPNAQTFAGAITGAGSLLKTAAGTLTLTAASTYQGGTTVSGGALQYGIDNALPIASNVTVNGGQLDLSTFSGTVGTVTLTSGAITGDAFGFPAPVLTAGNFSVANGTIGVTLAGTDGTVGLTKTGDGVVVLSATNLYTGLTDIQQGTLRITADAIKADVRVTGSAAWDVQTDAAHVGTVTLVQGTITGATGATLKGSQYDLQSGTVGVNLGGEGTPLLKTGTGSVVLEGSNTYTGDTTVNEGVLSIREAMNLGAGTLALGGGTLQVKTTGSVALDNAVTLNDAAAAVDVPDYNGSVTLHGAINGSGGLTKTGAGALTLASTSGNDYSGDTTVAAGTLLAQADNALSPASNLVIADGASVILDFGGGSGASLPGFTAPTPVAPAAVPALAPAGIAAVPEPNTLALLAAGMLGGLGLWLRRRK
jgi:fibronectin-binding autotransporter adhesin